MVCVKLKISQESSLFSEVYQQVGEFTFWVVLVVDGNPAMFKLIIEVISSLEDVSLLFKSLNPPGHDIACNYLRSFLTASIRLN